MEQGCNKVEIILTNFPETKNKAYHGLLYFVDIQHEYNNK